MRLETARLILLLAAVLGAAGSASAFEQNVGTNAAEFLRFGAGARALGMGEAYGPVAEGPEAIYWNPAGLAQLRRPEVSYTRSEFLQFFHHDFLAYGHPALGGTLGASFTRFSQDSMPLVTNANVSVGRFSPQSYAFAFAYALAFDVNRDPTEREYFREAWTVPGAYRPLKLEGEPLTWKILAGLSGKVVHETLHNRSASAFAFDGGMIVRPEGHQNLALSFSFRNVGTRQRFIREAKDLPAEMGLGLAYDWRWWKGRLLPALEAALPYHGNPFGKLGLEYQRVVGEDAAVALRGGYKTLAASELGPLTGLTVGLGARYRRLTLDFAFQPMAELGQVYRMTLGFGW